ncbi:cytidylyltransferase domain-containing protein [Mesorhizobium sp. IMUNJ 23232]|uniref:cytidylyltransferase domain-containing protein n=1 Tax=Mesorhizobium sp. IMUNJ 23232 TaxID=3376064 RepID=UPI0037A13DBA
MKQKNLLEIDGTPMFVRAMRKVSSLPCFDEVWTNSESEVFGDLARREGVPFHKRPEHLGDNNSTSEQFVYEFLTSHPCDYLVQVHSIAPLLTRAEIEHFVDTLLEHRFDTLLSGVNEQIQCMIRDEPLNFSFASMNATQELEPLQRISWTMTGWKARSYMDAYEAGECATFHGRVGFFPLARSSGMVVKTEEDYKIVKALAEAGFGA